MRISDWSSDLCSSDLVFIGGRNAVLALDMLGAARKAMVPPFEISVFADPAGSFTTAAAMVACVERARSEERRVGKECVSTCRSRGSPEHKKKNKRTRHNNTTKRTR